MAEITNAHLAADIVLFGRALREMHVLLIRRGWPPFEGCWSLPGGYLDEGETFAQAAARELTEETGLDAEGRLVRVGLYDAPDRDPRGRMVSVAYTAALADMPTPVAGDDAREARWVPVTEVLAADLAFDHGQILTDALRLVSPAAEAMRQFMRSELE